MPKNALPGRSRSPMWIGLGALALLLAVVVFVAMRGRGAVDETAAWEAEHRAEVVRLNNDAENLALKGDLKGAHGKYQELSKLVAGHAIKETALAEIVATARRNQDQIYQKLLGAVEIAGSAPQAERLNGDAARSGGQSSVAPAVIAPGVIADAAPSPIPTSEPAVVTSAVETPALSGPASGPSSAPAVAETMPAADAGPFPGVPKGPVTDEQVGKAIQGGVDYLLSCFKDGQFVPRRKQLSEAGRQGYDALCVYALATASKAIVDQRIGPKSPEMAKMLEVLKTLKPAESFDQVVARADSGGFGCLPSPATYTHALRACALATFNRKEDRAVLQADVKWLLAAETDGSYTYTNFPLNKKIKSQRSSADGAGDARSRTASAAREQDRQPLVFAAPAPVPPGRQPSNLPLLPPGIPAPPFNPGTLPPGMRLPPGMPALPQGPYAPHVLWDNSNSQYGLLGVWAGAEVGVEVPSAYWHDVEKHWNSCQLASGEWPYWESDLKPTYSMTCAGIASLLVTHDYLDAPLLGKKLTTQPYSSALQKGISWLEEGDHAVNLQAGLWFEGYSLYGMERVGLASGFKYFGDHNWFVELAAPQLPKQMANGSFGSNDDPVSTAYMLLFLSRGRHPILANKLRFDGNWTNRPRDLANLASYVSREMERPTNWQVVDAKRDADDWADAPILYIASQKALKFDDDVIPKLTKFINNGGLIFSHADAGSAELTQSVVELTKKMFPSQVLRDLPADHALYTLNYKITSPRPKLMGVSNGCRLVWVHSPNDLSDAWQMRSTLSRKEAFQMGTNLYLYATGKEKFRNRLDTPIIPQPELAPNRTVGLARLTHSGNWNPEPGAWQRFSRKLQWDTGVKLDLKEMAIAGLTIQQCRIAHLTGTEALKLTDPELAALKNFVTAGGTLLIDAAGGASAFTDAATAWLPGLLGDAKLNALEPNDPLLKKSIEGTVDAPEKRLRLYAFEQLRTDAPRIKSAKVGNGRVIFSGVDIATGLLATNTWGIVGYLPEFSEAFAKNLVLTSSR